jgi:hypothetical protein
MITEIIAKMLGKKLYKSQVTMVEDAFDATHYSDSLLDSLKWTMHGIYETCSTQPPLENKQGSMLHGVFGQICKFKLINITQKSIGICSYSKPKNEDILFMTNQMVYIPEKILKSLKKQDAKLTDMDLMFK